MTDEEHQHRQDLRAKFEEMSDAWRAQGNAPVHDENARLSPDDQRKEMNHARAEMRHLLKGKFDNAEERMTAAEMATRGRPISSRLLAEEMVKEAGTRKASMYAAAAGLSGFGR